MFSSDSDSNHQAHQEPPPEYKPLEGEELENDIRKHLPNMGGLEYDDGQNESYDQESASNNDSVDYE